MTLRDQAHDTLELLRQIDREARRKPWWRSKPARKIEGDTWVKLITQAVVLSSAIGAYDALEGRRNG